MTSFLKLSKYPFLDIWVNGLKTTVLHYIYKQTRKILFGIGAKEADFYGE